MLKTATKTVWFMHTSLSPVVPVSLWQTSATPRSTVLRMSLMRATAHILRFDFSLCFKSVLQCFSTFTFIFQTESRSIFRCPPTMPASWVPDQQTAKLFQFLSMSRFWPFQCESFFFTFSLVYWIISICNSLAKPSFAELTQWTSLSLQTTTLI